MAIPIVAALAAAAVPSIINGVSQFFTNKSNQSNYLAAQERANAFARNERLETQDYNSLENQFAQMARVGMNPNLLTGQSFIASSPVSNQSVSPPQMVAPQLPSESISQALLNLASARKNNEDAVTIKALRKGLVRQQHAEYAFTVANTNNAKAELPNIQKQLDVLNTTIDEISQRIVESDARTMNVREDTAKMRELRGTWRRTAEKQIDEIISRIAVNGAQRAQLIAQKNQILELAESIRFQNSLNRETRPAIVGLKFGEREQQKVDISHSRLNNQMLRFQFGQMENYQELRNVLGLTSDAINVVNQLIELTPYERVKKDLKDFMPFSSSSPSAQPLPNTYGSGGFSPSSYSR